MTTAAVLIADVLNRTYQGAKIDDRPGTVLTEAARRIAAVLELTGEADRADFLKIASMGGLMCEDADTPRARAEAARR